jgi:hypothetical protein
MERAKGIDLEKTVRGELQNRAKIVRKLFRVVSSREAQRSSKPEGTLYPRASLAAPLPPGSPLFAHCVTIPSKVGNRPSVWVGDCRS